MQDGHFLDPYGAPKPVHLKLDTSHYVRRPTRMQHTVVAAKGRGGVGRWVKLYRRVLFLPFSFLERLYSPARDKCGFSPNAAKMYFGGECVPWGSLSRRGSLLSILLLCYSAFTITGIRYN